MRIVALLLLTSCASSLRESPTYEACMGRIGVRETDDEWGEADSVCRDKAKSKRRADLYDDYYERPDSETRCRSVVVFGTVQTRCEHYESK